MTTATIRRSSAPPAGAAVVHLPALHAPFDEMDASAATRQVVVVGRQAGKTTSAARKAVKEMGRGRRVLYAAPTADQTSAFWDAVTRWTAKAVAAGSMSRLETTRLITFPATGGRIRAKTAWNADTLRGDNADLLILDEFAIMDPDAWYEVGAPMLLRYNGTAIFIFTPKRKNHAHALYVKALQNESGRWGAWRAPSHVNPHLSTEALADMTADMTEDAYRQEILAEFLDNDGAVFRGVAACLAPADAIAPGRWRLRGTTPAEHDGHHVVIGADWGKVGDYTVTSTVCATCAVEVELFRSKGDEYAVQRQRLGATVAEWSASTVLAESNAMGGPILEMLRRGEAGEDGGSGYASLPVRGFETTAASKPPLIENLALSLERAEVRWLDVPVATAELESYERKVSGNTGRVSYGAPAGVHDDTVIARALARRAAGRLGEMATTKLWA